MKELTFFLNLYLGIVAISLGSVLLGSGEYMMGVIGYILGLTTLISYWIYLQRKIKGRKNES